MIDTPLLYGDDVRHRGDPFTEEWVARNSIPVITASVSMATGAQWVTDDNSPGGEDARLIPMVLLHIVDMRDVAHILVIPHTLAIQIMAALGWATCTQSGAVVPVGLMGQE